MSGTKRPGIKRRKGKKGKPLNLFYIGLPALGGALLFLLLALAFKGAGQTVCTLLGVALLVTGGGLCGMELWDLYLKKRLEFGDDAVRLLQGQQKTVVGSIPYANIATVEVTDSVIIKRNEWGMGEEQDRFPVVGIGVFRRQDKHTFWPYKASEDDKFDFYIDSNIAGSLNFVWREIDERVHRAREKKTRERHDAPDD